MMLVLITRTGKQLGWALLTVAVALWACTEPPVLGDACALLPGDLVITEVMANPNVAGTNSDKDHEWFEIYNATSHEVSLNRILVWRESIREDGSSESKDHMLRNAGSLGPGEYFVLGDGVVGEAPIDYTYRAEYSALGEGETLGELTNATGTFVSGGIVLECRGRVIDRVRYGASGAGTPIAGQSLFFDGKIGPDALLNDRRQWWCSGGDSYDPHGNIGSPGEKNQRCGLERCQEDGVFRDARTPRPGELIISEVLLDPAGGADTHKYWFELYVAAAVEVDLNGLLVGTASLSEPGPVPTYEIDGTRCIKGSPGSYLVVAESSETTENGSLPTHAAAPGFRFSTELKDTGGTLAIYSYDMALDDYVVVDSAEIPPRIPTSKDLRSRLECRNGDQNGPYTTRETCICEDPEDCPAEPSLGKLSGCRWDTEEQRCSGGGGKYSGRTFALDGPAVAMPEAAALNDHGSAFCYSPDIPETQSLFAGIGTPGQPNFPCGTVACCPSACCSTACADHPDAVRVVKRPQPGDLVISEIYTNASSSDINKEWVELFVAHGPVDINGLWFWHQAIDRSVDPNTTTRDLARSYSPRCASGDTGDYLVTPLVSREYEVIYGLVPDNSGVVPDSFARVASISGFFDNSASADIDKSIQVTWGQELRDEVPYTFAPEEVTQMLSPEYLDPVFNDAPESFCEPVVIGMFEGAGTPGLPNVCDEACLVPGVLACDHECKLDTSGCVGRATWCGDGVAAGQEECDGLDLRDADCTTIGMSEGNLTCDIYCRYDFSACTGGEPPACGNGVRDYNELCDGDDFSGATCVTRGYSGGGTLVCGDHCRFDVSGCVGSGPQCGNGLLEPEEICDGVFLGPHSCASLGYAVAAVRSTVPPEKGDLVINEVYADPPGADNGRDFVELRSLAATPFDLNGLTVRSSRLHTSTSVQQYTLQVAECVEVQPGAYVVIGGDHAADDGAIPDVTIGDGYLFYASEMTMEICTDTPSPRTNSCNDLLDHTVLLTANEGCSWSLDPQTSDPVTDNDALANWSLSTASLNGFDYAGSPGVENE